MKLSNAELLEAIERLERLRREPQMMGTNFDMTIQNTLSGLGIELLARANAPNWAGVQ